MSDAIESTVKSPYLHQGAATTEPSEGSGPIETNVSPIGISTIPEEIFTPPALIQGKLSMDKRESVGSIAPVESYAAALELVRLPPVPPIQDIVESSAASGRRRISSGSETPAESKKSIDSRRPTRRLSLAAQEIEDLFEPPLQFRPPFAVSANNSTPTLATRASQDQSDKLSGETPNMSYPDLGRRGSQLPMTPEKPHSVPIEINDSSDVERAVQSTPSSIMDEAEKNFKPKTAKFWMVMLSNFIAMFLVALDRTIIATAIPRITDDFRSLGDIGWYGSSYMLTTAASQLLFGRIYKFYSLRWYDPFPERQSLSEVLFQLLANKYANRCYLASILIFEVGSAICGAAPNSPVFITGRSIAGIGSAGIFTGSMMIMIPMVPLHKRPLFQGTLNTEYHIFRRY
jgi:hypothetical protein